MSKLRAVLWRWVGVACLGALSACGGGGSASAPPDDIGADGGGGGGGGGESAGTAAEDIGARLSTSSVVVERDFQERGGPPFEVISLIVTKAPAKGYYYRYRHTERAINFVGISARSEDEGFDVQIGLSSPGVLPAGTYEDTITLEICIDADCAQPVRGSPFVVPVRLVVGFFAPIEQGLDPLAAASSVTLPHDLVDAVYSAALDAVVSVSVRPAPAINVHDLKTGLTRSQPLLTPPSSISLEPGGLRAAVGHDAAVSVVELATPGSPSAMTVARHALAIPVGEVVFDDRGRVHAFASSTSGWNPMFTLDLLTGQTTEVPGATFPGVYGAVQAVLHPSGDRLYVADRGLSPDDVFVSGLSGVYPTPLRDSPYHGDYAICGGVWPSVSGTRLYTACGNTFSSSADADQDMRYAGAMPLSSESTWSSGQYAAVSLSEHPQGTQVVVLEQARLYCDPRLDMLISCFTHISVYDSTTLALASRMSLAPVTVGSDRFAQVGRHVFHRGNGRMVLLSELRGAADAASSIILSQLP